MNKEKWKTIYGFSDKYKISNFGRVKSLSRYNSPSEIIMKNMLDKKGYLRIDLLKNNIRHCFKVHRLVAKAFLKNTKNKPQVNHKDGIKTNNKVNNLEWCTPSENMKHSFKIGLQKNGFGEKSNNSKLLSRDINYIREDYYKYNLSFPLIAYKFNVSRHCIYYIIKGTTWGHVK